MSKEGVSTEDLKDRIIEFIFNTPLKKGETGHISISFTHVPDAHISFWMGENAYFGNQGSCFDRNYVICDPEKTVAKHYVVFTRDEDIVEEKNTSSTDKCVKLPRKIFNQTVPTSLESHPFHMESYYMPDKIAVTIFSHLDNTTLGMCRQVSKSFHRVANSENFKYACHTSSCDFLPQEEDPTASSFLNYLYGRTGDASDSNERPAPGRWFQGSFNYVHNWSFRGEVPSPYNKDGRQYICSPFQLACNAAKERIKQLDDDRALSRMRGYNARNLAIVLLATSVATVAIQTFLG